MGWAAMMINEFPIAFFSQGVRLAGRVFRNTDRFDVRQQGVIVSGSWLTVKEQMPHQYAIRLAELGYTVFTFDFSGFGESGGELRQAEIPDRKIADLIAAADFLSTLSLVEPDTLTYLAVCASAQYALAALARGSCVFYGGDPGVASRMRAGRSALERYTTSSLTEMVPAYRAGDQTAAMFLEMDYYGDPARGALDSWRNEMATLSWCYWLLFDGLTAAHRVDVPALIVHSDGCVLPDNVRLVQKRLRGLNQIVWCEGGTQTDFYDRPTQVDFAVHATDTFLKGGQ